MVAQFSIGPKPVTHKHSIESRADNIVRLSFDLTASDGWHVYSTSLPDGGPISAELIFDTIYGLQPVTPLSFIGNETEVFDPVFDMRLRYFCLAHTLEVFCLS